MPSSWNNPRADQLWQAILGLKTPAEAKRFFRDLLTPREIIEFSNRWYVASLLAAKVPYTEIERLSGLSSTTIARIAKWLNRGAGGYRLALRRVHHHQPHTRPRH